MEKVRGSLAVAAMDGLVYAMGGGQPGVNHNSIEIFTPATNTWTPGPSMSASRFTTAGAALGSAIYMTGGFDGVQYLNSVEMLDPRTSTWHTVHLLSAFLVHDNMPQSVMVHLGLFGYPSRKELSEQAEAPPVSAHVSLVGWAQTVQYL